jgi:hypothetical protein
MSIHQFCHTGAGRYPVFLSISWIPVFTGMTKNSYAKLLPYQYENGHSRKLERIIRHISAKPFGSININNTMASPKTNSRSGAMFKPKLAIASTFINTPVRYRNNSFSSVINVAPKMAPGILPIPPMITIAIYSTESPRLNGSVVMLTM